MAFYHTCLICGCNLDPDEKCDCRKEELKKEQFFKKNYFYGSSAENRESFGEGQKGRKGAM